MISNATGYAIYIMLGQPKNESISLSWTSKNENNFLKISDLWISLNMLLNLSDLWMQKNCLNAVKMQNFILLLFNQIIFLGIVC